MDGLLNSWMNVCMFQSMDGWIDEWLHDQIDGEIVEDINGWMNVNGQIINCASCFSFKSIEEPLAEYFFSVC